MAKVSLKRILLALALVLGVLGSVLWIVGSYRLQKANVRTPETDSIALRVAIEGWVSQKSLCPTVQQLRDEKFIDPAYSTDPSGSPYLIECTAEVIKIHSLGPDRQLNTRDDDVVSKRKQSY